MTLYALGEAAWPIPALTGWAASEAGGGSRNRFCRGQGWSIEDDSVIISAFKSSLSVLQSYYCLFFACHDQILDNSRVEASDIG